MWQKKKKKDIFNETLWHLRAVFVATKADKQLKNKLEEAIKGRVGVFKYCNVHCVLKRIAFEKELKQEKQQMTHL